MSLADSLLTDLHFERLEEFPSYTSSIKCFGKPIIPALLSLKEKNEISELKEAAVRREAEISRLRTVRNAYYKIQNNDVCADQNESLQDDESVLPGMCALSLNCIHSNSSENSSFSDEMHVSTSKMPSTGICSTVHKGVIVCPKEIPATNKYDFSSKYPSNHTFGHLFSSSDCHLCQIDSKQGLCHSIVDNADDQMSSVSDEEEQDSIVEDTDFESLPTVVSAKKLNIQDTDDESNVTCLTQSTDLDKYMDCSIEYSSPDDLTAAANSQMSSQITLSCRSDDASSETLVNTESELTPCASAMAELNSCPEDDQKDVHPFCSVASAAAVTSTQDRACSVDSYLDTLKTGTHHPQTLLMKKSRSEPSHSDVLQKTSSVQEISSKECLDDRSGVLMKNTLSEYGGKSESNVRKRNHVRSNSYTLDSPSSALITAHANCGCDLQDVGNKTPHSCTPDKMSKSSMNLAFKKEKVNVVLPPTPDRDKMFPILNSGPFCPPTSDSDFKSSTAESNGTSETSFLDSSVENKESGGSLKNKSKEDFEFTVEELSPVVECSEKAMNAELEENHQSTFNSSSAEVHSKEKSNVGSDLSLSHSEVKELSPNESVLDSNQVFEMSPIAENGDKTENIQLILGQIFHDIQESQKMRVNQLLEEQNKQWLQLQEEFKDQERQLCAKLNLVNIPSGFPLDHSKGDIEENRPEQDIPSQLNIRPNVTILSLNDTSSKESHLISGLISADNSTESPFSEVSDQSNNIPETFSSDILLTGSSGALHSSASIRDSEFLPSNNVLNEMSEMKGNANKSFENDHKKYVLTLESVSNQSSMIREYAQTNLPVDGGSPNVNDSPVTGTNESETSTMNASFYRKTEVPSSLSLTHDNDFPFSSTESLKVNYDYQNILLQSSNNLPSLTKFYPLPVSGMEFVSTPSNPKRSILTCSMGSYQNKGGLPPQFCGKGEMCVLSPMSPCICVAVHEQEFNAECPNCHACMNCDTNCLKHVSYSKGDFQEVNGCNSWGDPNSSNCDTPNDQSDPLTSGLPSGKQGHITQGSVNGDTLNDHFVNTQDCDDNDVKYLLKENIDLNQMSLIRKAIIENKNFIEKNGNAPNKHITRKVTSVKTHPTYSFSKSVVKPKNLVTSRSPKKGDRNSPLIQKSRKTHDASLISKADALKKMVFPSVIGMKRIHSKEVLETLKDPSIQKKLERLPAMVKGYLTRRLFNSERVQDLVKTLKDTVLIIGKLSEELTSKANPVSEQDVDFHRQLIVQLMTTFRNVYDIFCTYSIKEQMKIISESRNIRLKKKSEENNANAVSPAVSETSNSSLPSKNPKISAATVKSLERKRRSSIDNRTYTIEDFKGCRPRICTKARMSSPSRIYRSAMDLNLKSKSKSGKTPHWK